MLSRHSEETNTDFPGSKHLDGHSDNIRGIDGHTTSHKGGNISLKKRSSFESIKNYIGLGWTSKSNDVAAKSERRKSIDGNVNFRENGKS